MLSEHKKKKDKQKRFSKQMTSTIWAKHLLNLFVHPPPLRPPFSTETQSPRKYLEKKTLEKKKEATGK